MNINNFVIRLIITIEDMKDKIKIAEVIGNATTGGVISCVFNYFKNINKNNFQIDFYVYGDTPYREQIIGMGGKVFTFPSVTNFFKCVSKLKTCFKREQYDIVHVHMTTLSFVPLFAAQLAGVKTRVCHAHSMTNRKEGLRYAIKCVFKPFVKLFSTDYAGCSIASSKWLYGKKTKSFIMHNAVDLNCFKYDPNIREKLLNTYGLSNKKVIGFIGRFEKQKNLLFLIDAFRKSINEKNDLHLVLIGSGSQKDKIVELVDKYKLHQNVLMLDETNNIGDMYSMFDLFVLPSLYEGLPLVGIEAQINGLPCLMSDKISKEVVISDSVEFISIDNSTIWAEKMLSYTENEHRLLEVNIASEYDIKQEVIKLENYYIGLKNGQ